MTRRRLKPLVWPVTLLVASGLTALLAEATAWSDGTVGMYGMAKMVSDLVLGIGSVWLVAGLVRVVRP
ncbi:hypothetical protein [Brevundimonas sp. LM2]|uniref:hypothetical protein n=1 Tax=Brevundimonas sp. LM2 TaxID=1938605 RepID=UPI0012371ED6|nr:hypothetical protein [Brevundimonas sp. LM2]